ncbi:MAG TPA: hypothetical protein VGV89_09055 [Thermoplasmata archaeon]|nr:hypothetical protein [Thermoplasmata archaeon]
MVNSALGLGGLVGVALSGAFMYWQIGRYAAPQVPRTLFDERKEFIAYTAGLFVGIPLAVPLILYIVALQAAGLLAVLLSLGFLVGGGELAQWLLLRTLYFGSGESSPFYGLGIRAGMGGLLSLALVTYAASTASGGFGAVAFLQAFVESIAIIAVEAAAGLLSVPARQGRLGGSPFASALFALLGFFLIGYGTLLDPGEAIAAAALAAVGGGWVFFRLRDAVLGGLLPPRAPDEEDDDSPDRSSPYGRITP